MAAEKAPYVLHWDVREEMPEALSRLILELRSLTESFIFLSGGASNMSPEDSRALVDLLNCLERLSRHGLRFAVGDGGTEAGIMAAAGRARRASRETFPLLGVAPAPEVGLDGRSGSTPIDENHSHILTITNESWLEAQKKKGWEPGWGYWGSETEAMYEVFGRLAKDRSSVAIVANGGAITLDEVKQNLDQGRSIVVVSGSGRAADAIVAALEGRGATPEASRFEERVSSLRIRERADRFRVFPMDAGPEALASALAEELQARR